MPGATLRAASARDGGVGGRGRGPSEYRLAFQSQGMTAEKWIGPTVESQIDELAQAGGKNVLLAPVGFVSDHVEILYDIDVLFHDYGKARGVTVRRSESLNDSPQFIAALAGLVSARDQGLGVRNSELGNYERGVTPRT